jgi:hypothetical protein
MTMPHERTRAVIGTRKFLEELRMRNDIPKDVRESAIWCLRHFPTASDIKYVSRAVMPNDDENIFAESADLKLEKLKQK